MALLADEERKAGNAKVMRELSQMGMDVKLLKSEGREVFDALDVVLNDLAPDINAALPDKARTGSDSLTTEQKAFYLKSVIDARYLGGV